jgi:hypothetical protein
MSIFDWIAEQRILTAIENGEMDNLTGQGQPIQWLDRSPFAEDNQMAYDLLHKNGFTLPWIEEGQEIRTQIEGFRKRMKYYIQSGLPALKQTREHLEVDLQKLNKKIMDYNMTVPLERFQILLVNFEQELKRANSDRPETGQDW